MPSRARPSAPAAAGQHRDAARHMEAADHTGRPARGTSGEIERARVLVRLHADQADEAGRRPRDSADRALHRRVLHSSEASISMSTSGPSTRAPTLRRERVDARECSTEWWIATTESRSRRRRSARLDQDDLICGLPSRSLGRPDGFGTAWRGAPWVFGILAANTSRKLSYWSSFGGVSASSV